MKKQLSEKVNDYTVKNTSKNVSMTFFKFPHRMRTSKVDLTVTITRLDDDQGKRWGTYTVYHLDNIQNLDIHKTLAEQVECYEPEDWFDIRIPILNLFLQNCSVAEINGTGFNLGVGKVTSRT